jgi:hypothetical protein
MTLYICLGYTRNTLNPSTEACAVPITSQSPTVPKVAAVALIMVGLGLIGMTAAELPGIAEQLEAPRWLMGILGGVLIAAGWQAQRPHKGLTTLMRPFPAWVELIPAGVAGIVLARLSEFTREPAGLFLGQAINDTARILFGVGIGILLGWVAYESTRRQDPPSDSSSAP